MAPRSGDGWESGVFDERLLWRRADTDAGADFAGVEIRSARARVPGARGLGLQARRCSSANLCRSRRCRRSRRRGGEGGESEEGRADACNFFGVCAAGRSGRDRRVREFVEAGIWVSKPQAVCGWQRDRSGGAVLSGDAADICDRVGAARDGAAESQLSVWRDVCQRCRARRA